MQKIMKYHVLFHFKRNFLHGSLKMLHESSLFSSIFRHTLHQVVGIFIVDAFSALNNPE